MYRIKWNDKISIKSKKVYSAFWEENVLLSCWKINIIDNW